MVIVFTKDGESVSLAGVSQVVVHEGDAEFEYCMADDEGRPVLLPRSSRGCNLVLRDGKLA
jgi:hypothetical protein